MVEERRRLRNAAARMRNPDLSHAMREWHVYAVEERRRRQQEQEAESRRKYALLQQHMMEVRKELDEQDRRGDALRKQLADALEM